MISIHKGFQIKPHPIVPTCYIVVTDGKGGKIPDVMSGLFTTRTIAQNVIDEYVQSKELKNDEKVGKRGV
jgi:hypothetical protein